MPLKRKQDKLEQINFILTCMHNNNNKIKIRLFDPAGKNVIPTSFSMYQEHYLMFEHELSSKTVTKTLPPESWKQFYHYLILLP